MSHSIKDDNTNDVEKIAVTNPKIDAEKLAEAIKIARALRAQGVSGPEYKVISPFRRQMRVKRGYKTADS